MERKCNIIAIIFKGKIQTCENEISKIKMKKKEISCFEL